MTLDEVEWSWSKLDEVEWSWTKLDEWIGSEARKKACILTSMRFYVPMLIITVCNKRFRLI